MQITSDGTVLGRIDPAVVQDTHEKQDLFNTKMLSYRLGRGGRPELIAHFRTKHNMPAVYLAAGTYPGLAHVEVMTSNFVIVSIPYRNDEDVDKFRGHFRDIWQLTQLS